MDRSSLFKMSGLPDAFGVVVLIFSLILLLAPYFSGSDFGLFKIPIVSDSGKKFLKIVGPILFISCIVFFVPIFPNKDQVNSATPSLTPEPSNAIGTVEKVSGDQQTIPLSDYRNFAVRVVDIHGRPIISAKVAWQTLECGTQVYVGETDQYGISTATNMCTGPTPGSFNQTATLIDRSTRVGFTQLDKVTPIGNRVTFSYRQQ